MTMIDREELVSDLQSRVSSLLELAQDNEPSEKSRLEAKANGVRLAIALVESMPPALRTHVTCPDCDGAGVLNAGPGGHDHCDRCGTTGRVRR